MSALAYASVRLLVSSAAQHIASTGTVACNFSCSASLHKKWLVMDSRQKEIRARVRVAGVNRLHMSSGKQKHGPSQGTLGVVRAQIPAVCRLPAVWPSDGVIDVQSLVVRYRRDLEPVLNGISFSVKGARLAYAGLRLTNAPYKHAEHRTL